MKEVAPNIFIGTIHEIAPAIRDGFAIVNLAGNYHREILGWKWGEDHKNDSNYVMHEEEKFLSLNFVDGPKEYYNYGGRGVERFNHALDFIESNAQTSKVLITCNKAESRSPSIALLYLSKRLHTISSDTFENAYNDFRQIYPLYKPGGIVDFIRDNWDLIQ